MTQWMLFAAGSLVLIAVSWKSLRHPRSHGFYRFFAWECILVLFLVNAKLWFYKPFTWNQIIAWFLMIVCLILLALGIHSLRTRGKPTHQREGDASLLAFEKTTTLVTRGIYQYIRHPLYSTLLLLTWGIFFKSPTLTGATLAILSTVFLALTAKADEDECIHFFGVPYVEYVKHTKMFVPYIL